MIGRLSKEDRELAQVNALGRAGAAKVNQGEADKRKTYTPHEIELVGMLGELAVCRFLGVEPDLEIYETRTDGKEDLTYKGLTANVKSTKYFKRPWLLIRPYDTHYDVYILCSVNQLSGEYKIQGYATREEVLEYTPRRFMGSGIKTRCVPFSALHPISELVGDA